MVDPRGGMRRERSERVLRWFIRPRREDGIRPAWLEFVGWLEQRRRECE